MIIEPNKHIGLLFQPRSGSHVVRHYLSEITDRLDLGELFNPFSRIYRKTGDPQLSISTAKSVPLPSKDNTEEENILLDTLILEHAATNASILNELSAVNKNAVFGINNLSYLHCASAAVKIIKSTDTQFIRLERADVLSSIISLMVAKTSGRWHNPVLAPGEILPYDIEITKSKRLVIPDMLFLLQSYVDNLKSMQQHYGELPVMYYEEFQHNVSNLRNMFTGIPNRIVSIPFKRMGLNYKEVVANLDDMEDLYENFVNENKEFFPQYFNKLPHIIIPESNGRQPRDLSLLQVA